MVSATRSLLAAAAVISLLPSGGIARAEGALLPEQQDNGPSQDQHPMPGDRLLPSEGAGLLGVEAGVRYTFPAAFVKGVTVKAHGVGPAVIVPFSYQVDDAWSALIELGYGSDWFNLSTETPAASGTIRLQTVTIQIGARWSPDLGLSRFQPVFSAGLGYYLSSLSSSNWAAMPTSTETNTTGLFVSIGCRFAITSRLGLTAEDRYALASTGAGSLGTVSSGGNTAALGMYFVWKK